jgi:hypothetical protein
VNVFQQGYPLVSINQSGALNERTNFMLQVAIPNQGQIPKASFVNELEPNNSFERRDSYDAVQSLKTSQSPKRNGASFLKELKTNSNPGFQSQQPKDKFNNNSFTMEALHSTTFAMMVSVCALLLYSTAYNHGL